MKHKLIIHKWGREITLYGSAIDRYADKIMRSRRFLDNLQADLDKIKDQSPPLVSIGPSGIGGEYQKEY